MSTSAIPLRRSLSYQQTKYTVIVAFIIGVTLSSIQIYIDYFAEQSQTRESVNNALATAHSAAFHAAFNIDESGALQITRGLVSNHPIIKATIVDDFGDVLGTAENNSHPNTTVLYSWIFGPLETITSELKNPSIHDQSVGQLSIVVDPSLTAESFMQRSIVVFMAGFIRNIILAVCIFAVFYLTFTRSILRASQPILKGKDKIQITLPERHAGDEIGALFGAFNEHIAIIEEQKHQIVAANENLESLVSERTEQLDQRNKELEIERSLAIEANMAKTEFLAMMSHEIRTPMSGILGMAELLAIRSSDSKQKEYADAIIESSKSLLALMNSVLDYSKYEHGQMPFERVVFDPTHLIYSIIFLLSASAESKHILLNSEVSENVPSALYGDPEKLRQVLLNLITNAIKFTYDGHVTVSVKPVPGEISEPGVVRLQFTVSDSGMGIDAEALEHIFEPYTQADGTISRRFGGSGMGLAICKQIIEQQNGQISCESPLGKNDHGEARGSRFVFELPFEVSEEPISTEAKAIGEETIPSINVLVVDDLSINRKLAQGQLENEGHRVFLAAGGKEALQLIEQEPINAVLMDLHMPGLDGILTTHKIRQGDHSDLPIIGITANISEQKIEECLAAGMNQVIIKPVDQTKLARTLRQVVQKETGNSKLSKHMEQIDRALVSQHLDALGDTKFRDLYLEAIESTDLRINELQSNETLDMEWLRERAHALAGLCANFGFMKLGSIAECIESAAEAGQSTEAMNHIAKLQECHNESLQRLFTLHPSLKLPT